MHLLTRSGHHFISANLKNIVYAFFEHNQQKMGK